MNSTQSLIPWVARSFQPTQIVRQTVPASTFGVLYGVIVLSVVVLLHSYYMHGTGRKKKPRSVLRTQTEVSAVAVLVGSVAAYIAIPQPSPGKTAVVFDLLFNGICLLVVQLCDNRMFVSRFMAVCKVTPNQLTLINWFVALGLVLPWFPAYWLVPFFYETNSAEFTQLFAITTAIKVNHKHDSNSNVAALCSQLPHTRYPHIPLFHKGRSDCAVQLLLHVGVCAPAGADLPPHVGAPGRGRVRSSGAPWVGVGW